MNPLDRITRRRHCALLGAAAMAAAGRAAFAKEAALREAAEQAGLIYGSTSDVALARAPEAYSELFFRHAALYAANLSWAAIARTPGPENFEYDPNVRPSVAHGLRLTGAHFLWHLRTPEWLNAMTPAEAARAVATHIHSLGEHFRGPVYSWNVVNEAINTRDGRPDGLRKESALLRILGPEFIERAFHEARHADPDALLIYNDYAFELATAEHEARRGALLRLLDRLQAAKAPIGGVGLQSHLKLDAWDSFREHTFRAFLAEIASRGLKILVTELDVDDRGAPGAIDARDRAVADVYREFLAVTLDQPAVVALVTWGLCDPYSWYNMAGHRERYERPDGAAHRPLPFDENFAAKPAYWAVLDALRKARRR